jgi:hypothetical protein
MAGQKEQEKREKEQQIILSKSDASFAIPELMSLGTVHVVVLQGKQLLFGYMLTGYMLNSSYVKPYSICGNAI